jgi:hypothetical protein
VIGLSIEASIQHKQQQQQVTCAIVTKPDTSQDMSHLPSRNITRMQTWPLVVFQEEDGVVRLDEPSMAWYLAEREVESYECFL